MSVAACKEKTVRQPKGFLQHNLHIIQVVAKIKYILLPLIQRVQWKVIRSVLEDKRDNLVVMATGKLFLRLKRWQEIFLF